MRCLNQRHKLVHRLLMGDTQHGRRAVPNDTVDANSPVLQELAQLLQKTARIHLELDDLVRIYFCMACVSF